MKQVQPDDISEYQKQSIDNRFQNLSMRQDYVMLADKYQNGGLKDEAAKYMANHHSQFLRSIDLRWNDFTCLGMKYLSTAKWQNLEYVTLGWNKINSIGCKYIASSNWKHLKHLSLNSNIIGDSGIMHLAKANWIQVQNLSLGDNKIGDEGLKCIVQAKWDKISQLSIDNPFTEVGAYCLTIWNSRLTTIQMHYSYNNVSKWSKEKVKKAVKQRYNISRIFI